MTDAIIKSSQPSTETSPSTDGNLFKNGPKTLPATESNILYNYRSFTYNWALGALTPEAISNHSLLERDIRQFAVLNSAGKGTSGIKISNQGLTNNTDTSGLINGFNTESPGRFDMFIDNISVDSLIGAGTQQSGSSIATNITFDVYEPYSMNGFIEALQVAARAAGYSDYMNAAFALRVQFQGWPDKSINDRPEIIPMSTRFFPITITSIEVDVSESGTRYKIDSVPVNQMGFGAPNALTTNINLEGNTVGEVLKNFFKAINQMVVDRTKNQTDQKGSDTYEISCPKVVTVGNPQDTKSSVLSNSNNTNFTSNIIKAAMTDDLKSVNVFKMADPSQVNDGYRSATVPGSASTISSKNKSTDKLNPKTGTVVFAAGSQIHDCIAAVVRDSKYTQDLLQNLDKVKQGNGLVTYFTVRLETDILGENTVNNSRFYNYRYVLEPYQMHYSRIPGQEQGKIDLKEIKQQIKREYNYIYTGKNEDIIKFALKFDNLYFTSIPAMLGNRPADNEKSKAAGADNIPQIKQEKSSAVVDQKNQSANSTPIAKTMVDASQNTFEAKAKAGQTPDTPYYKLAQNLHNAVLNNVDMIQGTLEILGDPYFLVTGGMSNADLNLKEPMLTTDGQAPTTQGDVFININFKNPIDLNVKTGGVDFGASPLSFSGVYRITTLKNTFKDGAFFQALEILRVPGQIIESETEKPAPNYKTIQKPGQQVTKDTAPLTILRTGIRPSNFNFTNLLNRGLPSFGLPGSINNFTNSLVGGATSAITSVGGVVTDVLTQVSGVTRSIDNLTNQIGIDPLSGVNSLTSGIRLSASGLNSLSSTPNLPAANIAAAGLNLGSVAGIVNAPFQLASEVVSGISLIPTAVGNVASTLVTDATYLATQGIDAVSGIIDNTTNAISGLQNIQSLDINAIGSKFGIDPSALAGLASSQLSHLVDQFEEVAKSIPENVDLGKLNEQGLSFSNIIGNKLKNLPATQAIVSAPSALVDPELPALISSKYGDVSSLLDGFANLSPLTAINKITNPIGLLTAGAEIASGVLDVTASAISEANMLVNTTIGVAAGVVNTVGSLAQNAVDGIMPANIGLGSIESNSINISNITQTQNNLGISVANQYGSLQQSPLAKLVKTNNILGNLGA